MEALIEHPEISLRCAYFDLLLHTVVTRFLANCFNPSIACSQSDCIVEDCLGRMGFIAKTWKIGLVLFCIVNLVG